MYLLLETEAVEEYLAMQAGEEASPPTLLDGVKQHDFATLTRWVWNDTEYGAYATRGPLLVQFEPGSALDGVFRDEWAVKADAGLFLASQAQMDEVVGHLRSILLVALPEGNLARLRLQDTQALASVLLGLLPSRAAMLLGPSGTVVWRENTGQASRWWRFRSEERAEDHAEVGGVFQFSDIEMNRIDANLAQRQLHEQIALTQLAPHSFQGAPEVATLQWRDQLERWEFGRFSDIARGMDIFRNPGFAAQEKAVTQVLKNTNISTDDHLVQATSLLELET
jgi:hypothetical protein